MHHTTMRRSNLPHTIAAPSTEWMPLLEVWWGADQWYGDCEDHVWGKISHVSSMVWIEWITRRRIRDRMRARAGKLLTGVWWPRARFLCHCKFKIVYLFWSTLLARKVKCSANNFNGRFWLGSGRTILKHHDDITRLCLSVEPTKKFKHIWLYVPVGSHIW